MTVNATSPRGTASDSLMTQVNIDNVLAVHGLLSDQADRMLHALSEAAFLTDIPLCADDVVSRDAKKVFQPKIREIFETHMNHYNEVREAVERLKQAAREYGFTDEAIAHSMSRSKIPRPASAAG